MTVKDAQGRFVELTVMTWTVMAKEFARKEKEYLKKLHLNGNAKFLSAYGKNREALNEEKIFAFFDYFRRT